MLHSIEVPDEAALAERLVVQLGDRLPPGSVVSPWKRGADYSALRVRSSDRRLVLRVPLRELAPSAYDGTVDFGALLEREVTAHRVLSGAGVPMAPLLDWHRAREAGTHSWMLLEEVEHDQLTDLGERELARLGEVLALIHRVELTEADTAVLGADCSASALADRLAVRVAAFADRVDVPGHEDVVEAARVVLKGRSGGHRLLHMDLRPDNLCFRDGRVAAVLDLSNCTTGDVAAELGRMRAYGLLDGALVDAYAAAGHELPDESVIAAYATDTFALLGLLGTDEFADQELVDRGLDGLARCRAVLCP
ncbi:phosphotransferase family protein [Umezawaea endophytica]|uniref:Phosphotransferase n=1 Tax=Umezawaea endophytica TaxID=1654476 RepID=A0A9X3AEG1_9PSEU|nr:phosphotransferase [Umezawaea endophytica]MCS7476806.1 phosphotransferase [Umezawaea endophytica]